MIYKWLVKEALEVWIMPSLRLEVEHYLGLKFPEHNGEPLIRFEESMEVPRAAESLMRGLYKEPEKVLSGFRNLHLETAALLELLLPRRSRLREWADALPEQPKDAEKFLRDTGEAIQQKERNLSKMEKSLITDLNAAGIGDIFPLSLSAFGQCSNHEPTAKIYLRPLGKLAELVQVNPEQLRMAVRIYFLFLILLQTGLDLDKQVYKRSTEDSTAYKIVNTYTARFLRRQSEELLYCYQEWIKAWGGAFLPQVNLEEQNMERLRAAIIFWRRRPGLTWDYCWETLGRLEEEEIKPAPYQFKEDPPPFKFDDF